MRLAMGLVITCACGRVGFDPGGVALDGSVGTDGAPDASDVACEDLPSILFCDEFDGTTKLTSFQAMPPSFVRLDNDQVFRGQTSLHAQTARTPPEAAWTIGTVLPQLSTGELHARWYHYYPSSAPNRSWASIHIISNVSPFYGLIFGSSDGFADVSVSENGDLDISSVPIPLDRWFCVQLRAVLAPSGSIETWIDGVPTGRLLNVDTQPMGGIENVHAGLHTSVIGGVNDLWTDELAIGTEPIPCL